MQSKPSVKRARLSAFYFGDHGPVWAASAATAEKRMAPFRGKINGPLTRRPGSSVPGYLIHWRITRGLAVWA